MTRQSLDLLRQRYIVEGRPLEPSVERNLRADARAGARAIVALIDKRRSENRSEGQRLRKMNAINIYWAGIQAMQRAVRGLGSTPQHLLIDAKRLKEIDIPQQAIIKGDAKSASIAAASILAKVECDAVMRMLDAHHPGMGSPTTRGIRSKSIMRRSIGSARTRPIVRKALGLPPLPPWPSASERAAD